MKCENGTNELRLIKKNLTDKHEYAVIHCCHRVWEELYVFSEDELLNISKSDFMNKLYECYNLIPQNHDYNTYYYCKTHEKQCIWNDEKLEVVSVSTSPRCNISCRFCDIKSHKSVSKNDKAIYFTILNMLKNNNLKQIELTSEGEPFIYKEDTLQYIENLTTNDCKRLEIMSNLTLLTEEDILRIYTASLSNDIEIKILASCSGITNETYKLHHNNDNFERVVNNIKLINSLDMLNCINFVITPENLHELDFFKQFWGEKGVKSYKCTATVLVDYCYPVKNATEIVLKSKEYNNYISKC